MFGIYYYFFSLAWVTVFSYQLRTLTKSCGPLKVVWTLLPSVLFRRPTPKYTNILSM